MTVLVTNAFYQDGSKYYPHDILEIEDPLYLDELIQQGSVILKVEPDLKDHTPETRFHIDPFIKADASTEVVN